jgi:cyanate permease
MGGALGSWIPGLFYDATGSYLSIMTISIFVLAGASIIVLRIPEISIKKPS